MVYFNHADRIGKAWKMSALETLATRWQHSIANSYFKRITYRPSKTHEEFRIVTPTKPENKGILLDQIFTME